ncbi:MAG: AgmX/PglI C-terminal domain-containing protein [Myxococcales bacterium]|nr:AgmX/PglI C-terminal domain-containing protein [Myxococcales bacterium]
MRALIAVALIALAPAPAAAHPDADVIRRVIRVHRGELQRCYEGALMRHRGADRVQVMIAFTIVARGVVADTRVRSSSLDDATFTTCLVDQVATWRFPDPPKGGTISVSYPFRFAR